METTVSEPESNQNDSKTSRQWFYELNGQQNGPVSEDFLIELIKANSIKPINKIWSEGMSGWVNLEQSEFAQHIVKVASPPPLNNQPSINPFVIPKPVEPNPVIWVLCFAPIIGFFAELILGIIFGEFFGLYMDNLWFITVILNIALTIYDEKVLEKAKINTSSLKQWVVFIVPVYLYQRAIVLKQDSIKLICWLVSFVFSIILATFIDLSFFYRLFY